MKLHMIAMAAVFGLSSPALSQNSVQDDESSLNGATLGKSMPGVNAGVPYRSSATPPVSDSGVKHRSAVHRKHRKHSRMQNRQ
jgi:hypothetical protein